MCGRMTQTGGALPGLTTVTLFEGPDPRGAPKRYNGAPSQDFWIIRRNPDTGEYQSDRATWGFTPSYMAGSGKPGPVNARCETIATGRMFASSYAKRRCLVPIDNFFEWKAIKGVKGKKPYAIAMKSREPFALAGIWTAYQDDADRVVRTFAVITTQANDLIDVIHDRMPVIIGPANYDRWLGIEPDPADLMVPYPSEPMEMWPISTRVNRPVNDDPSILDPVDD